MKMRTGIDNPTVFVPNGRIFSESPELIKDEAAIGDMTRDLIWSPDAPRIDYDEITDLMRD